jgi:probable rRNA maturation factor
MKIYIKNQQRLIKVNQQRIRSHLRKALSLLELPKAEISILLVNDSRMRILNYQYRGLDRTTDVLSFPQISDFNFCNSAFRISHSAFSIPQSEILLGDIVINLHQTKRQAAEHGFTLDEELRLLLIHGLLHLLGYDHEKSKYQTNKMRVKEKELLDAIAR